MKIKKTAVLAVSAAVVGGGVFWILTGKQERAVEGQGVHGASPVARGPEPATLGVIPSQRQAITPPATVGKFLADYWGSEWEAVKGRYLGAGISLEQDFSRVNLPAWNETASSITAKAESIHERNTAFYARDFLKKLEDDPDSFRAIFDIPEDVEFESLLPPLEAELADVDYQLSVLLGQYMTELDRAFEIIKSRGPDRSPLIDVPQEEPPDVFYTIHVDENGWYAEFRFSAKEFPALGDILNSRHDLVGERLRRLRHFARTLQ